MSYTVLAINPGHNGSACLLVDGEIKLYIEEERVSRQKYDGNPFRAMIECFKATKTIDELVIGGTGQEFHQLPWTGEMSYHALARKYFPNIKITYRGNEHHLGHAAGAFYNSGFDTAAAIVVDGAGSQIKLGEEDNSPLGYEVESIFMCSYPTNVKSVFKSVANNNLNRFENDEMVVDSAVSITKAYEGVSHYLGFGFIEAGKTMGLAPYGSYDENIGSLFYQDRGDKNKFIPSYPAGSFIDQGRLEYLRQTRDPKEWHKDFTQITDREKNLAWAVQDETQKLVAKLIQKAVDLTDEKNIVIAGGYGLNCVANYFYLNEFPELNIYVDPVSHDGGTAIGLAKLAWYKHCEAMEVEVVKCPLETLYLGVDNISEIHDFAKLAGDSDTFSITETTYEEVAGLLVDGNIVSIYQSRSEAGPRALGNRSILFDPRVKDGKDIVNKVKGREWFRPFAGTVLEEDAKEWFDLRTLESSPFMMYAVNVADSKMGELPAITHVDGTCRIQTVTKKQNKHYYELIKAFKEKTECPVLFNTSFNLAGDPLVESLNDAFGTLVRSELKYLYLPEIGKLITKNET